MESEEVREKEEFEKRFKELEEEKIEKLQQKDLLLRILKVSKNCFIDQREGLREAEERELMLYEDLNFRHFLLKTSNRLLKQQQNSLKKVLDSCMSLEEQRIKNDYLIKSYTLTLKNIGAYLRTSHSVQQAAYSEKIQILLKEVQALDQSVNDFTQEALQDPRKLIPYMRSATPNRSTFIKPSMTPY